MTTSSPSHYHPQTCWILTDGSQGMINQCLGVAESLGFSRATSASETDKLTEKVICLKAPWKWLTPHIPLGNNSTQFYALSPHSDPVSPPFPDLVLSCGRQAIAPALWIRKASRHKTKVVHIQNPRISPHHFEAVIVPKHDKLSGPNVIETLGAPHRVTPQRLQEEKALFPDLAPRDASEKVMSVILGGPSKAYNLPLEFIEDLIKMIHQWQTQGYRILISPSRRTPQEIVDRLLQERNNQVFVWDRETANPYYALLGYADAIFVTCDSVCMITEACITDKPVYILPLPGKGSRRFDQFHQELIRMNRIEWNQMDSQSPVTFHSRVPFNENNEIISHLRRLLTS